MFKRISLALVTGLCLVGSAMAFKTQFFGVGVGGVPIHEEITREALASIRVFFEDDTTGVLRNEFINALAEENTENDEAGLIYGQMHFDDSRLTDSAAYIWNARQAAIKSFQSGDGPFDFLLDGSGVKTNLGSAMHTIQDFFAHSNWVEINTVRHSDKIPELLLPRLGMTPRPFDEDLFAPITKLDSPAVVAEHWNDASNAVCGQYTPPSSTATLTSAYYDFAMSAGVDLGFFTDQWNNEKNSLNPLEMINWPSGRCVHGGDGPSARGINKDQGDRTGYQHARKAAVQATRAFMLEFLMAADALAANNRTKACEIMFHCRPASSNEVPGNFSVMDLQATGTFGSVSGKVLQVKADNWPARMLSYSYANVPCAVYRPWEVGDETDQSYDKIICPVSSPGNADLKIYQTALPTKVLSSITFALNGGLPAVTNVQPTSLAIGVATPFTVTGTDLPTTVVMTIGGSVCAPPSNSSKAGFTTMCTAGGTPGPQQVIIRDASDGSVIDSSRLVSVRGGTPTVSNFDFVAAVPSRLEVIFDQPMRATYGTTGNYVPTSSVWASTTKFVVTFSSFTPGGTITLKADSFVSATGTPIAADVTFTFPGNSGALLARWTFDDCTGADASGNGRNAVLNGGPTCVVGRSGNALRFSGLDVLDNVVPQWLELPRNPASALTFATWFKWEPTAGYRSSGLNESIWAIGDTQSDTNSTGIWISNAATRSLFAYGTNGPAAIAVPGQWMHVAFTSDGKVSKLYVNGEYVHEVVHATQINLSGQAQYISSFERQGFPTLRHVFSGTIDDAHLYNKVLSADEVRSVFLGN